MLANKLSIIAGGAALLAFVIMLGYAALPYWMLGTWLERVCIWLVVTLDVLAILIAAVVLIIA